MEPKGGKEYNQKELESELELREKQIEELKTELSILKIKYNKMKNDEENKINTMESQNESINELSEKNSKISFENDAMINKINQIEISNYDGKEDKILINKLINENMMLQLDLQNSKSEEQFFKEIVNFNNEGIEKLKAEYTRVKTILKELNERPKEEEEIDEIELKEKEDIISQFQIEKTKLTIEIKKKEEILLNIERDIRQQKTEISNINDEFEDQVDFYKEQIDLLKMNIKQLENDLKKMEYIDSEEIKILKDKLGELETKKFVEEEGINDQKEIKNEININNERLDLEIKRLKRDIENIENENYEQIEKDRINDGEEDKKKILKDLKEE